MYYCIFCKELHKVDEKATAVFKTGYYCVRQTNYPLGYCDRIDQCCACVDFGCSESDFEQ